MISEVARIMAAIVLAERLETTPPAAGSANPPDEPPVTTDATNPLAFARIA
jgi:hypothetical protein